MKFRRITPMQQTTFYLLTSQDSDIDKIANNPICFSPISYDIEEVEPGDIPAHSKIVVVDKDSKSVYGTDLETAIRIADGNMTPPSNDIEIAIQSLQYAFERNGVRPPAFIQLESVQQALNLVDSYKYLLKKCDYENVVESVKLGRNTLSIMGIEFRWPLSKPV